MSKHNGKGIKRFLQRKKGKKNQASEVIGRKEFEQLQKELHQLKQQAAQSIKQQEEFLRQQTELHASDNNKYLKFCKVCTTIDMSQLNY